MTLKQLLGIETLPLTEREVMRQIEEARSQGVAFLEFFTPLGKVKLSLSKVNMGGMMRDSWTHV